MGFSSIVVSAFAVIALIFAAVGVAALVAFAVTQRTREIGVRVALGAQTRDVLLLVAREGAWSVLAGLAVGVFAAWILRRSIASMLFGVAPGDVPTFVWRGTVARCRGLVGGLSARARRGAHRSGRGLARGVAGAATRGIWRRRHFVSTPDDSIAAARLRCERESTSRARSPRARP
jgi:ABC-type antimicrobial peptide transport system permease subunit